MQTRRLLAHVAATDLVVLCLSTFAAWMLAEREGFSKNASSLTDSWIAAAVVITALWLTLLAARGGYSHRIVGGGPDEFKVVVLASVLTAGTFGFACYLLDSQLPRSFVVLVFALGVSLLLMERYLWRKHVHRLRSRGKLLHRVVAVGGPGAVNEVVDILQRERYLGYQIVGSCIPSSLSQDDKVVVPVLGTPEEAKAVCDLVAADTVLVAGGSFSSSADLRRIGWQLEHSAIDLVVIPSLTEIAGPRVHLRPVAGLPLMHVELPQADAAGRWRKRIFDIVGAGIALIVFAPVMAVTACCVSLADGGPILFRQPRVGKAGNPFHCLKFRSMRPDAAAHRAELQQLNESDGALFKLRSDPRVTPPGRFLRRFSIDELPQLLNVLRGEMSLVGPRPPLPDEVAGYDGDVQRRLLVRPGMTGLWQVSGRSELSWRESVRLDLYYVDNWSMVGDLVILAKTIRAVILGRGAY